VVGAVTAPAASGTLYATVADLRNVMSGTDSGTGTAAQLTDQQLELALYSASNRVSVYAGNVYDSSTPEAMPPAILHDLTLDLARFWAAVTYLKFKELTATSPIFIAYQNAMTMLNAVRSGTILLDPAPAPGIGDETGVVINRVPPVFTGRDSNVRIDPLTGVLEADSPFWTPRTGGLVDGGPIYGGG
jgi:phage gp36-like protein